ncbi:MAG TPA: APC family permease [Bryobacteraceae bacterium]
MINITLPWWPRTGATVFADLFLGTDVRNAGDSRRAITGLLSGARRSASPAFSVDEAIRRGDWRLTVPQALTIATAEGQPGSRSARHELGWDCWPVPTVRLVDVLEAALTLLTPVGLLGVSYALPIVVSIIVLLGIVYFSYLQTIKAYPKGGNSYTVAQLNLGARVGVFAAAALMVDYLLNVAVGISTGVVALVSASPPLQPFTLPLCLGILAILTLINLRGVREAGVIFMAPTYLFLLCIFTVIFIGVAKAIAAGGHPMPVVTPPKIKAAATSVSLWLLIRTFSSACTAMTGVEAVSNGVQAFRAGDSDGAAHSDRHHRIADGNASRDWRT